MKRFLIGLLVLTSFSSNASEHIGRLLNAGCNTKHGIGEAQFAVYDASTKAFTLSHLNVVNEGLCKKGAYSQPSKLVDMGMKSIMGGQSVNLHKFTVNAFGIVKDVEEIDATSGKIKKLYSKLNLLDLNEYQKADFRIVEQDKIDWDLETIERIPGFIDMAKMD